MTNERPVTFEEFFQVRDNLLSAGKNGESNLDTWDDQLRPMATAAPDIAAHILVTLAASPNSDDREIAAIYVAYLFATRREPAIDLLQKLFQDANINVKRQALSTIDNITSSKRVTADEAVQLTKVRRTQRYT